MHFVDEGHKTFTAAADIPAGSAVKATSATVVAVSTAATDKIIGTINAAVKSGSQIDVRLRSASGTTCIKLAGTAAVGDAITSDAAGLGVVTTTTGNQIIGYALEAGVAGKFIELMPSTAKV